MPGFKMGLYLTAGSLLSRLIPPIVAPPAVVTPITIGFYGSSTPEHYLKNYGDVAFANNNVTWSSDGVTWSRLENGRFGQELGAKLYAATGRPVRFLSFGSGGSTLAQWESGSVTAMGNAIKAAGGVDMLFGQVGYNDISSTVPASQAAQLLLWRSLISKIRTASGANSQLHFIGITQDKPNPVQLAYVRQAEMTIINNDPFVRIGVNSSDLETQDGVHQNTASHVISANRFLPQVLAALNGTAQVRGPRVVQADRVDDTTTDVTIQHGLGGSITPITDLVGFTVYDGNGVQLSGTVTGVVRSGNVIRVTHPIDAYTVAFGVVPLNTTAADPNFPKDNSVNALPLEPTVAPVTIGGASAIPAVTLTGVPADAVVGSAYSFVPTTGGGNGTYTYALSGTALPTGFVFSTSTGSITAPAGNTLAVAKTDGIIITASSGGRTKTLTISLNVKAAAAAAGPTGKSAKIDYQNDNTATATWNKRTQAQAATAFALLAPDGSATGWTDQQTGAVPIGGAPANGANTGNNSGIYPDLVISSYYYQDNPANTRFAGLDDSKAYDITLFSSRAAADRSTQYTVNGIVQTLSASNSAGATTNTGNTQTTVTFSKIRPSGGIINVAWGKGTVNGVTSIYAYMNAAIITEFTV